MELGSRTSKLASYTLWFFFYKTIVFVFSFYKTIVFVFSFYKTIVFAAEVEYSYFCAEFRLEKSHEYCYIKAYGTSVFENIWCLDDVEVETNSAQS